MLRWNNIIIARSENRCCDSDFWIFLCFSCVSAFCERSKRQLPAKEHLPRREQHNATLSLSTHSRFESMSANIIILLLHHIMMWYKNVWFDLGTRANLALNSLKMGCEQETNSPHHSLHANPHALDCIIWCTTPDTSLVCHTRPSVFTSFVRARLFAIPVIFRLVHPKEKQSNCVKAHISNNCSVISHPHPQPLLWKSQEEVRTNVNDESEEVR